MLTHIYICASIHMYIDVYVNTHTYVYIHIYICTYIHKHVGALAAKEKDYKHIENQLARQTLDIESLNRDKIQAYEKSEFSTQVLIYIYILKHIYLYAHVNICTRICIGV
jgi:hypothetical protein